MDELHKIAEVYYNTANEKIRRLANEFYKAMDHDRDQKVSLPEFLAFMRKEGYSQMCKPEFFNKLNKDGTGYLKFWETMTLYYIINSGRPFCDGCGEFVQGMYFTCTTCFDCSSITFNVCSACFGKRSYVHNHKEFLDNFALLEINRMVALQSREAANTNKGNTSKAFASSSTSTAIVPVNPGLKRSKWKTAAVKVTEIALSAGQLASNLCNIQ